MADREVTNSDKDRDGDITALCNPNADWRRRTKAEAIQDIENKVHTYHVKVPNVGRVEVRIVLSNGRKYLRTNPDMTKKNNLDDLPNC